MEEKISIVKQISGAGDWSFGGRSGDKFEVVFENEDDGKYYMKGTGIENLPFKVGSELKYTISDKGTIKLVTEYTGSPKNASNGSKGSNGSFALSYAKDVHVALIGQGKLDAALPENIKKTAGELNTWLNENS